MLLLELCVWSICYESAADQRRSATRRIHYSTNEERSDEHLFSLASLVRSLALREVFSLTSHEEELRILLAVMQRETVRQLQQEEPQYHKLHDSDKRIAQHEHLLRCVLVVEQQE